VTNEDQFFVTCCNAIVANPNEPDHCDRSNSKNHFFRPIPATLHNNVAHIARKLGRTTTTLFDQCAIIEQNSTRRPQCGKYY